MTEQELAAIEAFLEARQYQFSQDWHGHHAWIENDEISISWGGGYAEVLQDCLDHWLSSELGRSWRWIWGILNQYPDEKLDRVTQEWHDAIEQAIAWHEALESEAE